MRYALAAIFLAFVLAHTANADVPLKGTFVDHYSADGTQVAGQVLVGLWLGDVSDRASLNLVRLPLPRRLNAVQACISASTRDGEYWLHGTYTVPEGSPDRGHLSVVSNAATNLANYKELDLGIRAELKADCAEAAAGVFIPVIAGAPSATLVALINSQRAVRVRAALQTKGETAASSIQCMKLTDGRSTAFDTVCRLPLPATPATGDDYTLTVDRRTRAGDTESDSFRIGLDRGTQ